MHQRSAFIPSLSTCGERGDNLSTWIEVPLGADGWLSESIGDGDIWGLIHLSTGPITTTAIYLLR